MSSWPDLKDELEDLREDRDRWRALAEKLLLIVQRSVAEPDAEDQRPLKSPDEWIELFLSTIPPGAVPIVVDRFSKVLPFLNPELSEKLAIISAVLACVSGVGAFQFTKPGRELASWRLRIVLCGLLVALVCFGILWVLSIPGILSFVPVLSISVAGLTYVGLFVAIGVAWGAVLPK